MCNVCVVVTLGFEEEDYRATEGAVMTVNIQKETILANPVTFRIAPLTVEEALNRSLIATSHFPSEDARSPNRAGEFYLHVTVYIPQLIPFSDENDFSTNEIAVEFFADEPLESNVLRLPADIVIIDDEVNEAGVQYFVAHLEVVEAVNIQLIQISRSITDCLIIDNDSKFFMC